MTLRGASSAVSLALPIANSPRMASNFTINDKYSKALEKLDRPGTFQIRI